LLKQVVKYSDDTDDIRLLQSAIATLEQVSRIKCWYGREK
jgi:hypothetical protein